MMWSKKLPKKVDRILVHVAHPAHVHFLKNTIINLINKDIEVQIAATEKELVLYLLDSLGLKYEVVGKNLKGMHNKFRNFIRTVLNISKLAIKEKVDLLVGAGSIYAAQSGLILKKPYINFGDTEMSRFDNLLLPFSDVIIRPVCYMDNIRYPNEIRYNGFKELAYLHPNYFKPSKEVLRELNISKKEKIIVMRLISWSASHDVGLRGIRRGTEIKFIKSLENYGKVFITSETKIKHLKNYELKLPPEKIHSLLYYADLYIGEGGTMATEAAVLGTPAIHIESWNGVATGEFSGNFRELRDKYGMLYFYPDQTQALEKAVEILDNDRSKLEWRRKRKKLLKDKIDVTAWMTDFIERYPESFYEYMREGKKVVSKTLK